LTDQDISQLITLVEYRIGPHTDCIPIYLHYLPDWHLHYTKPINCHLCTNTCSTIFTLIYEYIAYVLTSALSFVYTEGSILEEASLASVTPSRNCAFTIVRTYWNTVRKRC